MIFIFIINRYSLPFASTCFHPGGFWVFFSLCVCWLVVFFVYCMCIVSNDLPTLLEHLSSCPVLSWVRITRSSVLCVMLCRSLFVLLSFFFWPLYVLLRFTDSDCPYDIFKFFIHAKL